MLQTQGSGGCTAFSEPSKPNALWLPNTELTHKAATTVYCKRRMNYNREDSNVHDVSEHKESHAGSEHSILEAPTLSPAAAESKHPGISARTHK